MEIRQIYPLPYRPRRLLKQTTSKAAFAAPWQRQRPGQPCPSLAPARRLSPLALELSSYVSSASTVCDPCLRMLSRTAPGGTCCWTQWNTSSGLHPLPKQTFLFICTVWFSLWVLSWLRDQMQACRASECRPELKQDARAVFARDTVHLTKYFIEICIKKLKTRAFLSVLFQSIQFCNFLFYYVYELTKSLKMSTGAAPVLQGQGPAILKFQNYVPAGSRLHVAQDQTDTYSVRTHDTTEKCCAEPTLLSSQSP